MDECGLSLAPALCCRKLSLCGLRRIAAPLEAGAIRTRMSALVQAMEVTP